MQDDAAIVVDALHRALGRGLGGQDQRHLVAHHQIEIAGQSLRQLETTRIIEASFNRYLLDLNRVLPEDGRDSPAAGNLRGTLLVHRGIIAEEVGGAPDPDQQAEERAEMVRALQLSTIFEYIERKTIFARAQWAGTGQRPTAADMAQLVAPDEAAFREVLLAKAQRQV